MADKEITNPKAAPAVQPRTGGVTDNKEDNIPHDVFNTSGSQPVRDREADESKGTPVTRYFTKDGTPVEPSTLPGYTPSNLAGPDPAKMRDDVTPVVEYVDEAGNTVTHDSLKAKQEGDQASK